MRLLLTAILTNEYGVIGKFLKNIELSSFIEKSDEKSLRENLNIFETQVLIQRNELGQKVFEIILSYYAKQEAQKEVEKSQNSKMVKTKASYMVESELGYLKVDSYNVYSGTTLIHSTNGNCFPKTGPKEPMRTACFDDLMFRYVTNNSYRVSADMMSRVLRQQNPDGSKKTISYRTLDDRVIKEAMDINKSEQEMAKQILEQHDINQETGIPESVSGRTSIATDGSKIDLCVVESKISDHNASQKDEQRMIKLEELRDTFEDPENTTYVAMDDVTVPRQKEEGRITNPPKRKVKQRVKNTVVCVFQGLGKYYLSATGVPQVLFILMAFLLNNNLLAGKSLVFLVDGAEDIRNGIIKFFSWRSYTVILDWFHIRKKFRERLSMAIKGKKVKKEILKNSIGLVWLGKVKEAIEYLRNIAEENIKNQEELDKLIAYLERNKKFIPCYALRKKLRLPNSSNRVEKANDLIVAQRQKCNGMSWSKVGSPALAKLTTLFLNGENENWFVNRKLNFKLVSPSLKEKAQPKLVA